MEKSVREVVLTKLLVIKSAAKKASYFWHFFRILSKMCENHIFKAETTLN